MILYAAIALTFMVAPSDGFGNPPSKATRIVSLAPSLTEIIFAIGAGDRLVGVTRFADYPPAAKSIPRVGGFSDIDAETVLRMRPDVIVAVPMRGGARTLKMLAKHGIPTQVLRTESMEDLWRAFDVLGAQLGAASRANARVKELKSAYENLGNRCAGRPRTTLLVSGDPIIAVGPGSYLHHAMAHLGVPSGMETERPYATLDLEALMVAAPPVLVDLSHDASGERLAAKLPAPRPTLIRPTSLDGLVRLGPRFPAALEALSRQLGCAP